MQNSQGLETLQESVFKSHLPAWTPKSFYSSMYILMVQALICYGHFKD